MDALSVGNVVCQGCSKPLTRHCPGSIECLWLECQTCQMIIGPHNTIFYGKAARREVEARKRQNGV